MEPIAYRKIEIGDKVKESPVGKGKITGFSERGFPMVNCITVAWCEFTNGETFDPWDSRKRKQ
jgi:hypothetical protein